MDQIDKAIDDVARRMSEGHEAPGFRARVLARIEHLEDRRGSRRSALKVSSLCVAGGAAVALVFAVARAPWRTSSTVGTPAVPPDANVRVVSPRDAPLPPQIAAVNERTAVEAANASAMRQSARTSVADFEPLDQADGIAPLETPPIELPAISIDGMETMESSDVTQLTVPPIEVPAL